MPARTSKQSSDRTKAGRSLLAMLFISGPGIIQRMIELFAPHLQEGDPEPGFWGTLVALGRKLKNDIDRVVAADNALFNASAELDSARRERDQRSQQLSRQIIGLRSACSGLFVDLTVQELGFDQRTAQDSSPLLMQADRIAANLRSEEVAEAEYLFENDDFDPKKYADQIEAGASGLRNALVEVAEAESQYGLLLVEKRELTTAYDVSYLHGARTFESYCRLVGKDELADRVRPSSPRSASADPEPESEEGPDSETEEEVTDSATEVADPEAAESEGLPEPNAPVDDITAA